MVNRCFQFSTISFLYSVFRSIRLQQTKQVIIIYPFRNTKNKKINFFVKNKTSSNRIQIKMKTKRTLTPSTNDNRLVSNKQIFFLFQFFRGNNKHKNTIFFHVEPFSSFYFIPIRFNDMHEKEKKGEKHEIISPSQSSSVIILFFSHFYRKRKSDIKGKYKYKKNYLDNLIRINRKCRLKLFRHAKKFVRLFLANAFFPLILFITFIFIYRNEIICR